ncbi:MAG: hypothetical protein HZR80_09045 [Candidatus Heimdallarchaeota archaeon]
MAQSLKRSDSIAYIVTQWYNSVNETHSQYLEYLSSILTTNLKDILLPAIELQKSLGKPKSRDIIAKKEHLVESITQIEIELMELIVFLFRYLKLIETINDYELDLKSTERLVELVNVDITILEYIQISYKNIAKSSNILFKSNISTNKKFEENFDNYAKVYSRVIRKFVRETKENSEQIQLLFSQMKNEVNQIIQQEIEKEEVVK